MLQQGFFIIPNKLCYGFGRVRVSKKRFLKID
jgi:hypothetical protein